MNVEVAAKVYNYFSTFPKRSYPKGQILIFADETPDHIFYLTKGKVKQYDISYRGDEIIVNIYKSPSFFSMSWAINHTRNRFFYSAEEASEVHIVPVLDAVKFIKEDPDILFDLVSRVYIGIDALLARMSHLMSGTARSRLIFELIVECRRFGKVEDDGTYILAINEVDLAARSGLSRETVSREIHKLKERGYVSAEHNIISVKNPAALEKLLGEEL